MLQNLSSKFSLQQDVWTTKGNRHGFIGAAVTFINDDWEFKSRHLTLKLVPWQHKGKWLAEPMVNILSKRGLVDKMSFSSLSYSYFSHSFNRLTGMIYPPPLSDD